MRRFVRPLRERYWRRFSRPSSWRTPASAAGRGERLVGQFGSLMDYVYNEKKIEKVAWRRNLLIAPRAIEMAVRP